MVYRGTLLVLLPAWMCSLPTTEGGLEVTKCSSSSQTTLQDLYKIRSLYSPSIVTCSSLCIGDPACVSYIFSSKLCSLYSNNSEVATAVPIKQLLCQRQNRTLVGSNLTTVTLVVPTTTLPPNLVGCPQQIDNSTFQCLPLVLTNASTTCTCVSAKSMNWTNAAAFCQQYGMMLVAVQTLQKQSHINKLLTSYINGTTTRLWTSGKRVNQLATYNNSYVWTSVNAPVSAPKSSESFWVSGQPDNPVSDMACMDYRYTGSTNGWLYGDHVCTDVKWRVICEYFY